MNLRLATEADLPNLIELVRRVVPLMHQTGNFQWNIDYPNETVFRDDIQRGDLWVVDFDGTLAGVAALTTIQDAEYAQLGWDLSETAIVTHRLAVHPDFQGRGVAAKLLQQAENLANLRCIGVLRIDTNSENQATQRLFPKLGYRFCGELTLDFRPGLRFLGYEKRLI